MVDQKSAKDRPKVGEIGNKSAKSRQQIGKNQPNDLGLEIWTVSAGAWAAGCPAAAAASPAQGGTPAAASRSTRQGGAAPARW